MRDAVRRIADEYAGIAAVFAVLVAVKLLFVTNTAYGPVVFMDEVQYTDYARSLAGALSYDSTHYPLLYPLSIAVAFFFGDHFYGVIKLLNVLYSSAMVLPVYLICRMTLERKQSLACAGVLALIPFHLVLPRSVLSENLFFPLLLFAVWMVLRRPTSRPVLWDLGTGVLLGALYLTRYISLVIIPVFVVVWWLRPSAEEEGRGFLRSSRAKLTRLAVVVTATVATFGVWVVMQTAHGASMKNILGFGIASRTDPAQLTFARLGLWTLVYGAYFVLTAAPVLGLVLMSAAEALRSRTLGVYERAVLLVVGLNAAFAVAMIRHSWRAYYNYPDPLKVMGRHAIYFAALYVILAFMALPKMERWFARPRATAIVVGWLLPVALVVFAWAGLVESDLARSLTDRGAIDVYRMWLLGRPLLHIALVVLTAVNLVLWRAPKRALLMLSAGLAVFYLYGVGAYYDRLMLHEVYAQHGAQIARLADEHSASPDAPVRVDIDPAVLDHTFVTTKVIARSASYWEAGRFDFVDSAITRSGPSDAEDLRLVLQEGRSAEDALVTYEVAGTWYSIVEAP